MPEIPGGPQIKSSVNDGIPDDWKTARHLDIHDPKIASEDSDHNGYCALEDYANSLVN